MLLPLACTAAENNKVARERGWKPFYSRYTHMDVQRPHFGLRPSKQVSSGPDNNVEYNRRPLEWLGG